MDDPLGLPKYAMLLMNPNLLRESATKSFDRKDKKQPLIEC